MKEIPMDTKMNNFNNRNKQRAPRRQFEKPFWQIEKEKAEQEAIEKQKEMERGLEDTEQNFPTLGVAGIKSGWSGTRKFTELVSEWKADEDKKKEDEETEKTLGYKNDTGFVLPQFNNVRRFEEPEEVLDEEEEKPAEDSWTRVDHKKYRKPKAEKTFEEDEFDEDDGEHDDTVWGGQEEHQTCWDDRRA